MEVIMTKSGKFQPKEINPLSCGTSSACCLFWGEDWSWFHISYISSGDSTGSTAAQSEAAYDAIIAQHPSNILALNHETQGKFMVNTLKIQHWS